VKLRDKDKGDINAMRHFVRVVEECDALILCKLAIAWKMICTIEANIFWNDYKHIANQTERLCDEMNRISCMRRKYYNIELTRMYIDSIKKTHCQSTR
jgi:hypothetical protein